jgi:hypothetical protein
MRTKRILIWILSWIDKVNFLPLKKELILLLLFQTLLLSVPAHAVDISLNGFLQGNYSLNTVSENPDGSDFKWAEERMQIKLDAYHDPFRLFFKTDFFYDHINRDADPDFRELYLDYAADSFDVRAGRQIITWGVGDLIFINDVFPKDYEAFFSGRPLEYFKLGIDGVKAGFYPEFLSVEFVRFWMFDPMPDISEREEEDPATNLKNTEIAVRAYRDVSGFDLSLFFYRGFFRNPSMMPDDLFMPTKLTEFYPERSVYGVSLQGRALDGILGIEAGYYDSRQDRDGSDPAIPNSSTRFLIGYQRQLWKDFTLGVQYYGEHMHDYSDYVNSLPSEFPKQKRVTDLFTIRLTQFLRHQTLKLSFFSFWSFSDRNYLINPEVKYSFTDNIWAAIGAIVFGGGEEGNQFGQFSKNDNVYMQARYEF